MKDTFIIKDYISREEYKKEFDRIAKVILNTVNLITVKNTYLIREIEFYYYSLNHIDFYCHNNSRQLLNSRFYFHRYNDPEKYINLKRKGLDITFGNSENIYGGILIRTIQNNQSGKIYQGIGILTNLILNDIGGSLEIEKLYNSNKSVFDSTNSKIYLIESADNELKIFKKHRQGLKLDTRDLDKFYFVAKYNYFTYPEIEEL